MKWGKTVIDWWTKYVGVLALPILIGAVLLAWLQPVVPASLFCKAGDPCVQQWVSALSGPLALIGAWYTISEMINSRKTQTAVAMFSAINEARRYISACDNLIFAVAHIEEMISKHNDDREKSFRILKNMLDQCRRIITSDEIMRFETKGESSLAFTQIRDFIDIAASAIDSCVRDNNITANIALEMAANAASLTRTWATAGRNSAVKFLNYWEPRTNLQQEIGAGKNHF